MSNRILSLFILVLIFSGAYFFYYYFFVLNKGNLTLTGNVTNYEVNLYNEKLKTTFKSTCKEEVCELVDIAPFDYKLTIVKKGYKDYSSNVKIEKKSTLKLNFSLEKDLIIEKVEDETSTGAEVDVKEKIDELRKQKDLGDNYAIFDLGKNGKYYFKDNKNNTLSLFKDGEKDEIYSFSKVTKDFIELYFIENSRNMIFVKTDKKCFIINQVTGDVKDFEFHPKVSYVKKDSNVVSIVTEVGTYLYNMDDEKVEYFNFFKDFLYYGNDSYLGVIYSDDKERKANYSLSKYNGNLIVKYNYKTKEIKILKETELNITKIIGEAGSIYFYDDVGGKYLVSNIEE